MSQNLCLWAGIANALSEIHVVSQNLCLWAGIAMSSCSRRPSLKNKAPEQAFP
jgi:hypothetical protein